MLLLHRRRPSAGVPSPQPASSFASPRAPESPPLGLSLPVISSVAKQNKPPESLGSPPNASPGCPVSPPFSLSPLLSGLRPHTAPTHLQNPRTSLQPSPGGHQRPVVPSPLHSIFACLLLGLLGSPLPPVSSYPHPKAVSLGLFFTYTLSFVTESSRGCKTSHVVPTSSCPLDVSTWRRDFST